RAYWCDSSLCARRSPAIARKAPGSTPENVALQPACTRLGVLRMRGSVLPCSIRPPGCAQASRPRDFADGGVRGCRIFDHPGSCLRAVESALRGSAGGAAGPEADPALVLALGRVAPG